MVMLTRMSTIMEMASPTLTIMFTRMTDPMRSQLAHPLHN